MIVAELVMLVATVLIPAAKMEAINNPVSPVGSACTIK